MRSLLEIEQAADALPTKHKKEFVALLLNPLPGAGEELRPVRDIPNAMNENKDD